MSEVAMAIVLPSDDADIRRKRTTPVPSHQKRFMNADKDP